MGGAAVGGVCYDPPSSTHLNISREHDVEVFITAVKKVEQLLIVRPARI